MSDRHTHTCTQSRRRTSPETRRCCVPCINDTFGARTHARTPPHYINKRYMKLIIPLQHHYATRTHAPADIMHVTQMRACVEAFNAIGPCARSADPMRPWRVREKFRAVRGRRPWTRATLRATLAGLAARGKAIKVGGGDGGTVFVSIACIIIVPPSSSPSSSSSSLRRGCCGSIVGGASARQRRRCHSLRDRMAFIYV